jgi:ubiquitin conjugation factor E4 B
MDEIRSKRLAKLQAVATEPEPVEKANLTERPLEKEIDKPVERPVQQLAQKEVKPQQPPQTLESWCSLEFGAIFGVTLDSEDDSKVFLESTFTELVEEGQDLVFNESLADRVIIERLSEIGVENPFKWLRDAWLQAQQSRKVIKTKDPLKDQKIAVLNEIDRLTSNYGLVAFQIEDMFLNGAVEMFIKDIVSDEAHYADFIIQIIGHANDQGTLKDFLNTFVVELAKSIAKLDFRDSHYQLILNIFQLLLNEKPVAAIFTQIDNFKIKNPSIEPARFETTTILGAIFRLSPLQESVAVSMFDHTTDISKLQIKQIGESLQAEHKVLLDRLFFITNKIIRGSEQSRTDIMQYFATIVNKNHLRRGDHSDFAKLSTNAFMTNISLILIRLSQPFLDPSLTKLDKIDLDYFQKASQLIDLNEETRTNATNVEANEYLDSHKSQQNPNFISDCFFLTLTYLHYGLGGLYLTDSKLGKMIKHLKSSIENLGRPADPNNRMHMIQRMQLPRLQKQLSTSQSIKDAITSFFIHLDVQLEIFDFICGACAFLVRAIDPKHEYPRQKPKLPLVPDVVGVENVDNFEYFRSNAPVPFKYYPEFVVEGVVNYVQFICKFISNPMILNPRLNLFMEFMVVFLRCPELIGNPHLKGRLIEVLSIGTYPMQGGSPGFMQDIVETDPLLTDNLLYALLDFYVVVEKTGSSSQFYDKFNSRFHISCILEQIWKNAVYKKQLIYQSEHNEEFFIRFVARMLNDLTFLLDESLRQLQEVHAIQNELEARKQGASNMDGTNEDLESHLSSSENQARANIQLANRSLDLFDMFTGEVPNAFIKPEIVGRLASMLDYNLEALVGPKCSELKVREPEKYKFDPKELLVKISKVYVNLSAENDFVKSVAADSRSFKISLFTRAEEIMRRWALANEEFISKMIKFANRAEEARLAEEAEEQELGDVPDEFLDPLMYTLMEDPVILPGSKVSIDRSTIRSHLLSDSTDPFNRMPLKFEDVIPNNELKSQIQEFKRSKKSKDVDMKDV